MLCTHSDVDDGNNAKMICFCWRDRRSVRSRSSGLWSECQIQGLRTTIVLNRRLWWLLIVLSHLSHEVLDDLEYIKVL